MPTLNFIKGYTLMQRPPYYDEDILPEAQSSTRSLRGTLARRLQRGTASYILEGDFPAFKYAKNQKYDTRMKRNSTFEGRCILSEDPDNLFFEGIYWRNDEPKPSRKAYIFFDTRESDANTEGSLLGDTMKEAGIQRRKAAHNIRSFTFTVAADGQFSMKFEREPSLLKKLTKKPGKTAEVEGTRHSFYR